MTIQQTPRLKKAGGIRIDSVTVRDDPLTLDELELLYRERYADLLRLARAITGSPEAASDAVHDAFINAIRSRARFKRDGDPAAWLWRIVMNRALKLRRSSIPTLYAVGADIRQVDDEAAADPGIVNAIRDLPERQRLVLFLRYYADLDYGTIAAVLEISSGTVGATLHAALQTVRNRLEEVQAS